MSTVLKRMREVAGLTQVELAAKLGVCNTHVSLIENARLLPSPGVAQKLESLFNSPVEELLAPVDGGKRLAWIPSTNK